MAIITYPLNGVEYSAEDAQTYLCTRKSGVYSDENHFSLGEVTADRRITIGAGLAWMKISEFGGISFAVTEPVTVSVEGADANTDRTDLIVLRYDGNRQTQEVVCKKNSNYVQQSDGVFELALYRIVIPAGSTQIIASQIEDLRATPLCGIMKDGVTGIPVETLVNEFRAKVDKTISDLENSGSVVISALIDTRQEFVETIIDADQAVSNFKFTTAPNAIADFEADAQEKFGEFSDNGNAAITDFNERGDIALQNLDDAVQDVASGTDVMLQTSFNPSGQVGQVAFEKNTRVYIGSFVENSIYGPLRVQLPLRGKEQELIDAIKRGDNIVFRFFTMKIAGEYATIEEMENAENYINDGGYEFDTIFDTSKPAYDFRLVSITNVNPVSDGITSDQKISLIGMMNFQWYALKIAISTGIAEHGWMEPLSSLQEE